MRWQPFGKDLKDLTNRELAEVYNVAKHYPYPSRRADKQWSILIKEIQKRRNKNEK